MIQPNCTASWVHRTVSGQDAYGNDTFTDQAATVDGVFVPGGSSEVTQAGDVVTTQPSLYLPLPAPAAIDQVTVNGTVYEVDGTPQTWPPSPFGGWQPDYPVVVRLREVTG